MTLAEFQDIPELPLDGPLRVQYVLGDKYIAWGTQLLRYEAELTDDKGQQWIIVRSHSQQFKLPSTP